MKCSLINLVVKSVDNGECDTYQECLMLIFDWAVHVISNEVLQKNKIQFIEIGKQVYHFR